MMSWSINYCEGYLLNLKRLNRKNCNYPHGRTVVPHGHTALPPRPHSGVPTATQWYSHGHTVVPPRPHSINPTAPQWYSHGHTVVPPRPHSGTPTVTQWYPHGHTVVHPRSHSINPTVTQWYPHGHTVVHPRSHSGTPTATQWYTHGHTVVPPRKRSVKPRRWRRSINNLIFRVKIQYVWSFDDNMRFVSHVLMYNFYLEIILSYYVTSEFDQFWECSAIRSTDCIINLPF